MLSTDGTIEEAARTLGRRLQVLGDVALKSAPRADPTFLRGMSEMLRQLLEDTDTLVDRAESPAQVTASVRA